MSDPAAKPHRVTGQKRGPSILKIPTGDDRERLVCAECGFIHYENPKVVVGVVAVFEETQIAVRTSPPGDDDNYR